MGGGTDQEIKIARNYDLVSKKLWIVLQEISVWAARNYNIKKLMSKKLAFGEQEIK